MAGNWQLITTKRQGVAMDAHTRWAIEQIQRYLQEGNAAAVVELGEHVVAHEDEDVEAFVLAAFCLALAYERLERWDRALHWFEQCLILDPTNPTMLSGRGRVLMKMDRNAEAADVFRHLAQRYSDRSDYHGAAGSVLLRLGELNKALHHLEQARRLDPTDPYVLNDLASAYLLAGDPQAALRTFKQAVDQITPDQLELARDIRESIEEVRAALVLQGGATAPLTSARIADLHDDYASPPERPELAAAETPDTPSLLSDSSVRAILLDAMREQGCRPRQILAALHLWSDFLESLPAGDRARVERHGQSWAAAVLYAVGRLDRAPWAVQSNLAGSFAISPATLSRRFSRLRRTLAIEVGDPRYCTAACQRRAVLIEQVHEGKVGPERLLL